MKIGHQPTGLAGRKGYEQPARCLGIVGEVDSPLLDLSLRLHEVLAVIAVSPDPSGKQAHRAVLVYLRKHRQAASVYLQPYRRTLDHLERVPYQAEPGDIGACVDVEAPHDLRGTAVQLQHRLQLGFFRFLRRHTGLDGGRDDAGTERLREHKSIPGPDAPVRDDLVRVDEPGHGQAELELVVENGMASHQDRTRFLYDIERALDGASQVLDWEFLYREGREVHCRDRPAAHCIDIGKCVDSGYAAEVVRVVYDGREKIHRLHERQFIGELVHPRIVGVLKADQKSGTVGKLEPLECPGQVPRPQLARSPGARNGGREPNLSVFRHELPLSEPFNIICRVGVSRNAMVLAGGPLANVLSMGYQRCMELVVLGCGGIEPTSERMGPSFAVRHEGTLILLDAGAGATRQMVRAGLRPEDIDAVCITHRHPDHTAELWLLFLLLGLHGRRRQLAFIAPPSFSKWLEFHMAWSGKTTELLGYEIEFTAMPGKARVGEVTLEGVRVPHMDDSVGYRLSAGGKALAYSGDSGPGGELVELARGADLFLCEATLPAGARMDTHLAPEQAAEIAAEAGAKRVVVTHVSPPSEPDSVGALFEKRGIRCEVARDLAKFRV